MLFQETKLCIWDTAVWAAGAQPTPGADGDADEAGWAAGGESASAYAAVHKKIRRTVKTNRLTIGLAIDDARMLDILGLAIYYKLLPTVA